MLLKEICDLYIIDTIDVIFTIQILKKKLYNYVYNNSSNNVEK